MWSLCFYSWDSHSGEAPQSVVFALRASDWAVLGHSHFIPIECVKEGAKWELSYRESEFLFPHLHFNQTCCNENDFAESPHSECADLIDPGNKVADGIVNPSASRLLLRIHIRTEPVWYGSSVSIIRGSCLSPPHPQPPPYLGPSHALWANLGRVCLLCLRRTDSGVCGGARCNRGICWNCPTRTKIGAAGMESSVFCMRFSGFQSVSGLSLDKQDVPYLLHIFKSAIFMFFWPVSPHSCDESV